MLVIEATAAATTTATRSSNCDGTGSSKCRIQIGTNRLNEKFTNAINEQWNENVRTLHGAQCTSNGDGSGGGQSKTLAKNNT